MLVESPEQLLALLRANRLISATQVAELEAEQARQPADAAAWARRLVQRGLLTAWQAEQLLAGAGLVLGQYRLLERLGAGSSGQVFKAEHLLMKRLVALKVFTPPAQAEEGDEA